MIVAAAHGHLSVVLHVGWRRASSRSPRSASCAGAPSRWRSGEKKKKPKPKPNRRRRPSRSSHPARGQGRAGRQGGAVVGARAAAAAAPVAMNLAMSNSAGLDVGPGIGLEGRAPEGGRGGAREGGLRRCPRSARSAPAKRLASRRCASKSRPSPRSRCRRPRSTTPSTAGAGRRHRGEVQGAPHHRRQRRGRVGQRRRRAGSRVRRGDRGGPEALALQAGTGLRQAGRGRRRPPSAPGSSSATSG